MIKAARLKKKRLAGGACMLLAAAFLAAGCGRDAAGETAAQEASSSGTQTASSEGESGDAKEESGAVADASEMAEVLDIVEEGMEPVVASALVDGTYDAVVSSSSSMFRITDCVLRVADGEMTADLTMGGTGYLYLFMGSGEEAAGASKDDYIPYTEDEGGAHHFVIPVAALDEGFSCAAFSKNKEKWYDRMLLVRADSLPDAAFKEARGETAKELSLSDGTYEVAVTLSGGSGKASVASPAKLTVKDGVCSAEIIWSSPNYDYMIVNEERFDPVNTEGNSTFVIPVSVFDHPIPVRADTTAMSTPHEIEYTLQFDSSTLADEARAPVELPEPAYAKEFSFAREADGTVCLTIGNNDRYVLLTEGSDAPADAEKGVTAIPARPKRVYLASTSVMDHFRVLDALSDVSFSSTKKEVWEEKTILDAYERGAIRYAGKYSAPDVELLLSGGCDLAIENTMIYHTPEIKEQLEALGIPVLVERSSYETDPLGRLEWIRLYGFLTGKAKEADAFFDESVRRVEAVGKKGGSGKTVAFFSVGTNRMVKVRKPGDYITKMIALAGGTYVPVSLPGSEENALSTMNMEAEAFFSEAKDADILIYNSTIDGELKDLAALLKKNGLLESFAAVKSGEVYCTAEDMFRDVSAMPAMIEELHAVIAGEDTEKLTYLYRLK